jgi:glutathione S-transferase
MLPIMMTLYLRRLGDASAPLMPRVTSEIDNHMGYLDAELGGSDFFVGKDLTAADVNLAFVVQLARMFYDLAKWPNLARFIAACEARPAYRRSVERGGPYAFGR